MKEAGIHKDELLTVQLYLKGLYLSVLESAPKVEESTKQRVKESLQKTLDRLQMSLDISSTD